MPQPSESLNRDARPDLPGDAAPGWLEADTWSRPDVRTGDERR
jgi:hypothetical protein